MIHTQESNSIRTVLFFFLHPTHHITSYTITSSVCIMMHTTGLVQWPPHYMMQSAECHCQTTSTEAQKRNGLKKYSWITFHRKWTVWQKRSQLMQQNQSFLFHTFFFLVKTWHLHYLKCNLELLLGSFISVLSITTPIIFCHFQTCSCQLRHHCIRRSKRSLWVHFISGAVD